MTLSFLGLRTASGPARPPSPAVAPGWGVVVLRMGAVVLALSDGLFCFCLEASVLLLCTSVEENTGQDAASISDTQGEDKPPQRPTSFILTPVPPSFTQEVLVRVVFRRCYGPHRDSVPA